MHCFPAVPEAPSHFTATAISSQSMNVSWLPQHNGGLQQTFTLDGREMDADAEYVNIQSGKPVLDISVSTMLAQSLQLIYS